MYDISLLTEILEHLHNKDVNFCYLHAQELNQMSIAFLNESEIENKSQSLTAAALELLLRICNIMYNRTDKTILPIEDGIYDLLLEKYKKNNPDFQVGADVIEFQPEMKPALIFYDQEQEMKEVIHFDSVLQDKIQNGFFLEDIIYPDLRIRSSDFDPVPEPSPENELITKRKHDTVHNHPELVGTLDKCKFVTCKEAANRGVLNDPKVKILERDFFADHIKRGIIDPNKEYWMCCELKYDGVSVEADCTDVVVSARSRGDTGIGQASDMTPILAGYKFPHIPKIDGENITPIGVKFEAIIQKDDLAKFNEMRGYQYKNCRTAIVGLTGSSDAWRYRDLITLVPLQLESRMFKSEELQENRIAEIEFMNEFYTSHGCPMRYVVIHGTYIELLYQIKMFAEEAEFARSYIPFMYDGIVISYLDIDIRKMLGRENFINKYSMAVKFNPLKKQTIFRGYKYTVGQDGSITPMIYYDPVEFYGTIHPKSSGHSYARFKELNLAVGDIIDVEYMNDVMPYVSKPFNEWNENNQNPKEQFPTICPVCGSELVISESGKSVRCINSACGGRSLARMVNMFSKLNLAEFGEATVDKLGKTNIREICEIAKEHRFQDYGFGPGESAILENEINKFLTQPIKDYELFGALGFTSLASKSWQLIFQKMIPDDFISYIELNFENNQLILVDQLLQIKGLGRVSVDTIIREYPFFRDDIIYCMKHCNIVRTFGTFYKKQIRATGFRDRELFEQLREMGYDADDNAGVTKSTDILLIPFEGYNQGNKLKKVSEKCQIIAIEEFKRNMNLYL